MPLVKVAQEALVPFCSLTARTQKLLKSVGLLRCTIYWSIPHKCQLTFAPYIFHLMKCESWMAMRDKNYNMTQQIAVRHTEICYLERWCWTKL